MKENRSEHFVMDRIFDSFSDRNNCGTYNFLREMEENKGLHREKYNMYLMLMNASEIEFPKTLKNIGEWFFFNAQGYNYCFNEGLEQIGSRAFYGCMIKTVKLPKSMRKIEGMAFSECRYLNEVTCNEGLKYIGNYAFHCWNMYDEDDSIRPKYRINICYPSTLENVGEDIINSRFVEYIGFKNPEKIVNYEETAKLFNGYEWPKLNMITLLCNDMNGTATAYKRIEANRLAKKHDILKTIIDISKEEER